MYKLAILFSVFFVLNATAKINNNSNEFNSEESELEKILFVDIEDTNYESFDINSIEVIEIEEEVELGFDTANYLPKDFNALKGMHDLDSHKFQLVLIDIKKELGYSLCSRN